MPIVKINPEAMLNKAAPYVDILRRAGFDIQYPRNPELARGNCTEDEMIAELQDVTAVIATAEHYTPRVIAALPKLRVIARAGVGYDRVDVAAATRHNVAVTITPTANHEAVAELMLALLFAVAKRIVSGDAAVRQGGWPREPLVPIRGKTVGILGLGRIGRSVAVRCQALGMRVIATEQQPDARFIEQHAIQLVGFDQLIAESDVVTIHCPLNAETQGLFNANVFGRMKTGSIFINSARGPLVDESALYDALKSGHLLGAGLDVFELEPPRRDNPLFMLDNVVLSPHIAGADELSLERMGIEAAECIAKLSRNQWPEGAVVNALLQASWKW